MADREKLLELAERVEGLPGPDRGADLAIQMMVDPEYATIEPEVAGFLTRYGGHPAYTASLDAAMTLLLDRDRNGWHAGGHHKGGGCAYILRRPDPIYVVAATPALALTAAALRARASEQEVR